MAPLVPCPRCGVSLPAHASFCNACGAALSIGAHVPLGGAIEPGPSVGLAVPRTPGLRPGFVPAGRGMSVCHGCGVIAPTRRDTCALCQAPIGTSLEAVPPRADGCVWAFIRSEMKCRQCGRPAPIDEPDVDGTFTCPHCNAMQAFDVEVWQEGLEHAHAIADLAGPDPEGRARTPGISIAGKNPYAAIGVDKTFATLTTSGMSIAQGVMRTRNLELTAAPGQPLCKRCGSPLEAERRGARGDEVQTRCVGCGETATYENDPRLRSHAPSLVCVVADALRSDKVEARLDQTSAGMVVALKCPSCGAALTALEGAHFVDCTFCKTSCRIPSRTLLALKRGKATPDTWWALFRGPSAKRRQIEGGRHDDDEDDEDAPSGSIPAPSDGPRASGGGLESPPAEPDPTFAAAQLALRVFLPFVMLALVAALFYKSFDSWRQGYLSSEVPPPGAPAVYGPPPGGWPP